MSQRGEKNVPFDGILRAPPSPSAALALPPGSQAGRPTPKSERITPEGRLQHAG